MFQTVLPHGAGQSGRPLRTLALLAYCSVEFWRQLTTETCSQDLVLCLSRPEAAPLGTVDLDKDDLHTLGGFFDHNVPDAPVRPFWDKAMGVELARHLHELVIDLPRHQSSRGLTLFVVARYLARDAV